MSEAGRALWIISDSSGETAHHVAEACLEQFSRVHVRVTRIRHVRSPEAVTRAMHAASESKAIVFYTFVDDALRATARESAAHYEVIAIDIIGDALAGLGKWLSMTPRHKPGRVLDKGYFERVACRDFAQQHDDGQRPEELPIADVVLLGLSRSGKTPLMHMLAEYGLRAANVPIVPGVPPPEQLSQVESRKVFVLRIQPERLRSIRMQRLKKLGLDETSSYVDARHIQSEMRMIETLLIENPEWRAIDMSRRAVEEAAGEILQLLGPVDL